MDSGPLDDDELEIEMDEHGYRLLIEPLDEPLHDGGLWERLVGRPPGLADLEALLRVDADVLSSGHHHLESPRRPRLHKPPPTTLTSVICSRCG